MSDDRLKDLRRPKSELIRRPGAFSLRILLAVTALNTALMVHPNCYAAEHRGRNQAAPEDTLILPPDSAAAAPDGASKAAVAQALRAVGQTGLGSLAVADATVDADGCTSAPLTPRMGEDPGMGLQAVAQALRRHGVEVTVISAETLGAVDQAAQDRIQSTKGSFNLAFGEGAGRWFATRTDMLTCTKIDDEHKTALTAHAPLAAMLGALHQTALLAITESHAETKGARWNMIEGELSSSGNGVDAASSQASVAATLVLKNGMTPWSDDAVAQGALRPPLDQPALAKLQTYMQGQLKKMNAAQKTGSGEDPPQDGMIDRSFNAIAGGDLAKAPEGGTQGPSADATLQAAADRLVERLSAALPKR